LCEIFEKCWNTVVAQCRLRKEESAFFSESDIHHALASSLESENVNHVHVELPIPLEPSSLWAQIEKFGKVSFGKDITEQTCAFYTKKHLDLFRK